MAHRHPTQSHAPRRAPAWIIARVYTHVHTRFRPPSLEHDRPKVSREAREKARQSVRRCTQMNIARPLAGNPKWEPELPPADTVRTCNPHVRFVATEQSMQLSNPFRVLDFMLSPRFVKGAARRRRELPASRGDQAANCAAPASNSRYRVAGIRDSSWRRNSPIFSWSTIAHDSRIEPLARCGTESMRRVVVHLREHPDRFVAVAEWILHDGAHDFTIFDALQASARSRRTRQS